MWFYEIIGDGFGSQIFPRILINSQNVLMKSLLHKEIGAPRWEKTKGAISVLRLQADTVVAALKLIGWFVGLLMLMLIKLDLNYCSQ